MLIHDDSRMILFNVGMDSGGERAAGGAQRANRSELAEGKGQSPTCSDHSGASDVFHGYLLGLWNIKNH
jgi:hypothetical protein